MLGIPGIPGQDEDDALGMPAAPGAPELPPPVAQAAETLRQVEQVIGPAAPSQGGEQVEPDVATPRPPAPAALPTSTPQEMAAGARQEMAAGLERQRGIQDQQADVALRRGNLGVEQAAAQSEADQALLSNINAKAQEAERVRREFDARLQGARARSEEAKGAWASAKPTDWFDDKTTGQKLMVGLGIALAHLSDTMASWRGRQSNLGMQAMQMVNNTISQHRAQEAGRIERLAEVAKARGQDVVQVEHGKAAALADLEDKYAGIQKQILASAVAKKSQMGMDAASLDRDSLVLDLRAKANDADARSLKAVHDLAEQEIRVAQMGARGRRGRGGGGAGGAAAAGDDPYAGLNANQRLLAQKRDRDEEAKDQQRVVPGWDGKPKGLAPDATEARQARKNLGTMKNIVGQLESLKSQVKELDWVDRSIGGWSSKQQKIKGTLDTMMAPISQVLGSGTPQAEEARSKLETLTSSVRQSPEVAIANAQQLQDFLRSEYDNLNEAMGLAPLENAYRAPTKASGQQRPMGSSPSGAPAAPARQLPPGAVPGKYKGVAGYRLGKQFFPF